MESNNLYYFNSKQVLSNFRAGPIDLKIDDINLIEGNYTKISFPIIFKQSDGKKMCDILDTGFLSLFLISDRMKAILEENKLTGWKVYPIKLYDKKNNEIFGYSGFSITGRCSPPSYAESEIIEKQYVPTGPICKLYKGMTINNWDGSDFVLPQGRLRIIINKKAADILKKNKITNVDLENLAEYETTVWIVEKDYDIDKDSF
jgi:hypothetical protein